LIGAKNVQTYAILANFQMEEMEEQMLDGNFFWQRFKLNV